jgi:diguanylate cyclase (GGDEF)-like protein/PAS domain S-box-containing protein
LGSEGAQGSVSGALAGEQLDLIPLPVVVYEPASLRIVAANGLALAQYRRPAAAFHGLTLDDLVVQSEQLKVKTFVEELVEGQWARSEWTMRRADGSVFPAAASSCALRWQGQSARLVAVEDLSDMRARDAALAESEAVFRETMGAAQVGIFVLQDFKFRFANVTLCRWFGYEPSELVDRLGPLDLIVPEERDFVLDQMRRRAAGEQGKQYVITCLRKDGTTFPGTILGAPSSYRGKPASVGTLVDLTELRSAEEQVRRMAFYDTLTGLPNRVLLADRVAQAITRAERDAGSVALLFIDLDHFKNVNDTLGHATGDSLLAAVSQRLAEQCRRSDTLARLGGDEFVFLLSDATPEGASEFARKLVDQFVAPIRFAGQVLPMTASIGIAFFPEDGSDFDGLLRCADLAMYQAKATGRNSFRFFTRALNDSLIQRVELEHALRRGFEQKELALHYQPIVDIADGRIVSVEALMRWFPPGSEPIPPARFIPVAESSGQILEIGAWAIKEACRQSRAWRDAGLPPVSIGVNVSAVQFFRGNFVAEVAAALKAWDLPGDALDLEITESMAMEDVDLSAEILRRISELGVGLSIDDFGTGYSSLACLKGYPVDRLKIDRSFVRDVVEDEDSQAIAGAVVAMGKALRHTVVAEGVETEEQREWLARQGCDLVQGFLFSPAVGAEEIASMLTRDRG